MASVPYYIADILDYRQQNSKSKFKLKTQKNKEVYRPMKKKDSNGERKGCWRKTLEDDDHIEG